MAQRHIVCLTFDFDAMSGFVARGMTSPTPISRGEFGAVAVPRILDLLARYNIRGSFFMPGVVIGTYPKICEMIVKAGHEIGITAGPMSRPPACPRRRRKTRWARATAPSRNSPAKTPAATARRPGI